MTFGIVSVLIINSHHAFAQEQSSGSPIATKTDIRVGKGPDGISVNNNTDTVYVWNSTRSNLTSIYAINGTENKVTDIIQVPIGELADLVFDPKTNKGYAVSSINSKVVVIDGNNNKIKNYINVETSKNRVRSLSVNPNTNEIYILNTTSTNQKGGSDRTTISVIDSFTDTVVDLVKLDKGYDIILATVTFVTLYLTHKLD